jgi:hypothetical protein
MPPKRPREEHPKGKGVSKAKVAKGPAQASPGGARAPFKGRKHSDGSAKRGPSESPAKRRDHKPSDGEKGASAAGKPAKFRRDREEAHTMDMMKRAKLLWNELRERKTTRDRRRELVKDLLSVIRGRMRDVVLKHAASRIVQSVIRFGTAAEQLEVATELSKDGLMFELSKAKYGHQLVTKILRWAAPQSKGVVFKALQGQFGKLVAHAQGAVVVDMGWVRGFSAQQRWLLEQEFWGPSFRFLKDLGSEHGGSRTLENVLEGIGRQKGASSLKQRREIATSLGELLEKAADKALLGLPVVHRIAADFFLVCQDTFPGDAAAMVPRFRDALVALAGSRDGGKVGCAVLGYGGAKDRKMLCRKMGESVSELSTHEVGAMLIVRALAVTDDTKMLLSTLLKPLGFGDKPEPHKIASLAADRYGRKILLQLLAPSGRWLEPFEKELMREYLVPASSGSKDDDEAKPSAAESAKAFDKAVTSASVPGEGMAADVELVPTSKKDSERRAQELLEPCVRALTDACLVATAGLLVHPHGYEVLLEAVWTLGMCGSEPELVTALADALFAVDVIPGGGLVMDSSATAAASASSSSSSSSAAAAETTTVDEDGEKEEDSDLEDDDSDSDDDSDAEEEEAGSKKEEEDATVPLTAEAMLEHPKAALVSKVLLMREKESKDVKHSLASAILATLTKLGHEGVRAALASNRGAFTLVNLLENGATTKSMLKLLKGAKAVVKAAPDSKGKALLLAKL